MYHIIGLGNVGERYENTRHNVGFMALNRAREKWGFENWKKDPYIEAYVSCGELRGEEVVLVKPNTYMNNSGRVIPELKNRGLDIDRCALVHDEIDMHLSSVKVVFGRGHGGHRGVRSVIDAFGTKEFLRFRIGVLPHSIEVGQIKREGGKVAVEGFILGRFNEDEAEEIGVVLERVSGYLEMYIKEGREMVISSCAG